LWTMRQRPTAIFCLDNQLVPDIYRSIESAGLSIPADVAVLGRGNPLSASNLKPVLTTISVPAFHIGKRAAELLLASLIDRNAPLQKVLLPCSIIEQRSV
jgi:LacI family transcriptional regulator